MQPSGFWKANDCAAVDNNEIEEWPAEMRAAFLCRCTDVQQRGNLRYRNEKLIEKMEAIWAQWEKMQGSNAPLQRSMPGEIRDFDINLDGMAHYGMLPDMLQDICNSGLTPQDLVPLFRSANDYVEMWATVEERAHAIKDEVKK